MSEVQELEKQEEEKTQKIKKVNGSIGKLQEFLETKRGSKAAIWTHSYPDPDAISSQMALSWFLRKAYDMDCYSFHDGVVSHPQNKTMINLLDPDISHVTDYVGDMDFECHFLVDTVPSHSGTGRVDGDSRRIIPFDVVIDHHKSDIGSFDGIYINLKAGSCAATIYHIIRSSGIEFSTDVDVDIKVATALMVGVSTDTENLMSDDSTEYEFRAWSELFDFKNAQSLKQIVNYERPKLWIKTEAAAVNKAEIKEGIGVVGLGLIATEHRDMIAHISQQMVSWEDVNTAIAFGIVGGKHVEGCVRSKHPSMSVPNLCRKLGEDKRGTGGGKLGKGAYSYDLAGFSVDDDEDDSIIEEAWSVVHKREKSRIFKVFQK